MQGREQAGIPLSAVLVASANDWFDLTNATLNINTMTLRELKERWPTTLSSYLPEDVVHPRSNRIHPWTFDEFTSLAASLGADRH